MESFEDKCYRKSHWNCTDNAHVKVKYTMLKLYKHIKIETNCAHVNLGGVHHYVWATTHILTMVTIIEIVALTARYERILFFPRGEVISVSSLTAYIYR